MTREEAICILEDAKSNAAYIKDIEVLDMAIAALREQEERKSILITQYVKVVEKQKWISATENPPEEWRDEDGDFINYFIYSPEFGIDIGNYLLPAKTWLCVGVPAQVTHWMPVFIEPPKEEV